MKKFLSVFVAASLLIVNICINSLEVGAIHYTSGDLTCFITEEYAFVCDCTYDEGGTFTIPSSFKGKPVIGIMEEAFSNCNATKIVVSSSVINIREKAFYNCKSLKYIELPDTVKWIGVDAFYGTQFYNNEDNWQNDVLYCGNHLIKAKDTIDGVYKVKEGTQTIAWRAFYNCSDLDGVELPEGLKLIGEYAFYGTHMLNSCVVVPNSVHSIGFGAFQYSGICEITLPFLGSGEIGELYYGETATNLGYIFGGNGGQLLRKVVISDSATSIGSGFYGFKFLTSITIPDSVSYIGDIAFWGCSSLNEINVGSGNQFFSSQDGVLFNKYKTRLICCPKGKSGEYVIPDSVTRIDSYAFAYCDNLTSVTIPDRVTSIGNGAFEDCNNITSITIPFVGATKDGRSNTHFGYIFGASSYNDNPSYVPQSLKTVKIIGGTNIGKWAFYGCSSLTSITIPNSVTSIGDDAFRGCNSLTSIIIPDSVTSIGDDVFFECNSFTSITIPFVGATKDGTNNTHFGYFFGASSYIENSSYVPQSLKTVKIIGGTNIGEWAFYGCNSLTSITIPNSVTNVGSSAFYDCDSLTSIAIPDSVISIGNNAFDCCVSLKSITISNSVKSIGDYAFSGCSNLIYVHYCGTEVQWNLVKIGDYNACLETATIHYLDEWTVRFVPTCTAYGEKYSVCSICGKEQTETIAALGHDLVHHDAQSPTCTEIGWEAYDTCSRCDYTTYVELSALGHDLVNHDAQAPTCTEIGWDAYDTCSRCDYTTYNKSAVLGHDIIHHDAKAPTCTEIGWEAYDTCSRCDYTTYVELSALGHDLVNHDAQAPTCTEIGWDAYVLCSRCDYTTYNELVAIGHDFGEWQRGDGGKLTHICATCGAVETYVTDASCFKYTIFNGKVTITDYIGFESIACIPSTIEGYPVTTIGENAFSNSDFTIIAIPDNVTSIGNGAFQSCRSLKNITIPGSITSIGVWAFFNCDSLTSITILDGVTSIDNRVFYDCDSLTNITIPDSVTRIGYEAFAHCDSLTSITIPSSVTSIDWTAFDRCGSLIAINVNNGNQSFSSKDGIVFNKDKTKLICCPEGKSDEYVIPNTVTSIADNAFNGCNNISNIYYYGTEAQWNSIEIGDGNDLLNNVIIHTNCIGEWIVRYAPSCTENGEKYRICIVCDKEQTESIPAAHDLVHHDAKEPTCTEIGWDAYDTCSRCDYTTYVELPTLGHDLVHHDAQAPTCTEIGWDAYDTCSRCDYTTYNELAALDHDLVHHDAKAPTCTEIGWDAYDTCSRCDYTTYHELAALDHDLVHHDAKAPTCTEIGWEEYDTCSRCDYTTYNELAALGHKYGETTVIEPEYNTEGYSTHTCTVCGHEEKFDFKPPLTYIPGDIDGVEGITDADAEYLLMYTFFPEDYPVNQECDFNGDGLVNDADAEHLLMYTFFPEDYPLN